MVEYLWRKRVYCDGRHNAWPAIRFFKGRYFVSFSNQDSHFHRANARAMVVHSADGLDWSEPIQLTYQGLPICDVSSLFTKDGRLFVEMYARIAGKQHLTLVAGTEDGDTWSDPRPLDPVLTAWHVTTWEGFLYRASFEIGGDGVLFLWRSSDGYHWEKVSPIAKDRFSAETALHFLADGRIVGVARRKDIYRATFGGASSSLLIAEPPYSAWGFIDLNTSVQAPCLCEVGGRLILAGREVLSRNELTYAERSCLWSWDGDGFLKEADLLGGLTRTIGWTKRATKTYWDGFPEDFTRIVDGSYMDIQPVPDRPDEALVCDYWGTASEADIWVTALRFR